MVMHDGAIVASPEPFDPEWLHLCLEGDFEAPAIRDEISPEQFFMAQKLLLRLFRLYRLSADKLVSHNRICPGDRFPWSELVISPADGYH